MKLFISWSGPRSRHIAEALAAWLPMVFETVKPWISSNDIEIGQRWSSEIAGQLDKTQFGIVCVTPENKTAPWIQFEAGALAKSVDSGRVVPLLWEVRPSDLSNAGPLSQFQAKTVSNEGIRDIVLGLNKLLEDPRSEDVLNTVVDALWPKFEDQLGTMPPANEAVETEHRPMQDVLEDLVSIVRRLDHRIRGLSREKTVFPWENENNELRSRNITKQIDIPQWMLAKILLESTKQGSLEEYFVNELADKENTALEKATPSDDADKSD
ncbi:hypothetical protein BKI51_12240 [Alphaproteobacteria bacterium AO1-B]|nr:hypothetical protein BKI51_12240 [Alphaproteobacteria bacterium AO1-B]